MTKFIKLVKDRISVVKTGKCRPIYKSGPYELTAEASKVPKCETAVYQEEIVIDIRYGGKIYCQPEHIDKAAKNLVHGYQRMIYDEVIDRLLEIKSELVEQDFNKSYNQVSKLLNDLMEIP